MQSTQCKEQTGLSRQMNKKGIGKLHSFKNLTYISKSGGENVSCQSSGMIR